jgi:hypothetical protein
MGSIPMPKLTFDPKVTWGNILTAVGLVIAGFAAWYTLSANVAASAKDIDMINARLIPVIQSVDGLETRMAVVDRNQVAGKEAREQFQDEARISLEQLRQQNVIILQTLAGITARLEERDRLQ